MVDIHIYRKGDDDPQKCTALKLEKEGLAKIHSTPISLLYGTVLDPYSEKAISPQDSLPLIPIDLSWKSSKKEFEKIDGEHRALPFLVSSNPVSYGKPFRLNTAEAILGSLYILGYKKKSLEIASKFDYGEEFFKLNYSRLENYSKCSDSSEIVDIQENYL